MHRRLIPLAFTAALAAVALALPAAAMAAPGDIYVGEAEGPAFNKPMIVRVNPTSGAQSIVSPNGLLEKTFMQQVAFEPPNNLLVTNGPVITSTATVVRVNLSTGQQTTAANKLGALSNVQGVALDPQGNLVVTDGGNKVVRVNKTNQAETPIASGPPLNNPRGVAVAPNGDIFLVNGGTEEILRIPNGSSTPAVYAAAGVGTGLNGSNPQGLIRASDGTIYVAGFNGKIVKVATNGTSTGLASGGSLVSPFGVALEKGEKNLVVIDEAAFGSAGVIRVNVANGAQSTVTQDTNLQTARGIAVDTTTPPVTAAPKITNARLSRSTFRVDKNAAGAKKKRAKKGTTITYTLSQAASTTFSVATKSSGRRVRGSCKKKTRSNRHKRKCTRLRTAGSFTQAGLKGANSKPFSGKIGTKSLKPGSYRLTLVAKAGGKSSAPVALSFKIVR